MEPSRTTSKPQKSRSFQEYFRNTIRSVLVWLEKIRWIRSALSSWIKLMFERPFDAGVKVKNKRNGIKVMASSRSERN